MPNVVIRSFKVLGRYWVGVGNTTYCIITRSRGLAAVHYLMLSMGLATTDNTGGYPGGIETIHGMSRVYDGQRICGTDRSGRGETCK